MRRPPAEVLPDAALIPDECFVKPPPVRFTHRLVRAQPYWYEADSATAPRGELPAGAEVVVEQAERALCRVVDARGLRVWTPTEGVVPR